MYSNRYQHNKKSEEKGPNTLGYVPIGDFRDVIVVPPLANITVSLLVFLSHFSFVLIAKRIELIAFSMTVSPTKAR